MLRRLMAIMLAAAIIGSLNLCAARKAVAVLPSQNVSGYDAERVAEIMTEQLTAALHSGGVYEVVERARLDNVIQEQELQSVLVDPQSAVEFGKLKGADYSLLSKVTAAYAEHNPTARAAVQLGKLIGLGELGASAYPYLNKVKAKIALELRLVDNATGAIVFAGRVEGSKSGSSTADAFHGACREAAENFLKGLANLNPFRAHVAAVDGEDVYIDGGADNGLRLGDTLIVAHEGEPVIIHGRIVAVKHNEVGRLKVVEVNSDYAVCKVERGANHIQTGDAVNRE